MARVPTVKVQDGEGDVRIINASDFGRADHDPRRR